MTSPRAAPFYCPYCGEETIEPEGEKGWRCDTCARVFSVALLATGDVSSSS